MNESDDMVKKDINIMSNSKRTTIKLNKKLGKTAMISIIIFTADTIKKLKEHIEYY